MSSVASPSPHSSPPLWNIHSPTSTIKQSVSKRSCDVLSFVSKDICFKMSRDIFSPLPPPLNLKLAAVQSSLVSSTGSSGGYRGGGRGGPPHLIFRPNWNPKGGNSFFFKTGPPLSQGLDDCPPPTLFEGLDPLDSNENGTFYLQANFDYCIRLCQINRNGKISQDQAYFQQLPNILSYVVAFPARILFKKRDENRDWSQVMENITFSIVLCICHVVLAAVPTFSPSWMKFVLLFFKQNIQSSTFRYSSFVEVF